MTVYILVYDFDPYERYTYGVTASLEVAQQWKGSNSSHNDYEECELSESLESVSKGRLY